MIFEPFFAGLETAQTLAASSSSIGGTTTSSASNNAGDSTLTAAGSASMSAVMGSTAAGGQSATPELGTVTVSWSQSSSEVHTLWGAQTVKVGTASSTTAAASSGTTHVYNASGSYLESYSAGGVFSYNEASGETIQQTTATAVILPTAFAASGSGVFSTTFSGGASDTWGEPGISTDGRSTTAGTTTEEGSHGASVTTEIESSAWTVSDGAPVGTTVAVTFTTTEEPLITRTVETIVGVDVATTVESWRFQNTHAYADPCKAMHWTAGGPISPVPLCSLPGGVAVLASVRDLTATSTAETSNLSASSSQSGSVAGATSASRFTQAGTVAGSTEVTFTVAGEDWPAVLLPLVDPVGHWTEVKAGYQYASATGSTGDIYSLWSIAVATSAGADSALRLFGTRLGIGGGLSIVSHHPDDTLILASLLSPETRTVAGLPKGWRVWDADAVVTWEKGIYRVTTGDSAGTASEMLTFASSSVSSYANGVKVSAEAISAVGRGSVMAAVPAGAWEVPCLQTTNQLLP